MYVIKITTWNFLKFPIVLQSNFLFNLIVPIDLPQNFSIAPWFTIYFLSRSLIPRWLSKYMVSVVPLYIQDRMYTSTCGFKIEFVYSTILSHLCPMKHKELFRHTLVNKVQLICKIILPHFLTSAVCKLSWHVIPTAVKVISHFLLSYIDRSSLSLLTLTLVFILVSTVPLLFHSPLLLIQHGFYFYF